jgi:hypothetical protein
MADVTITVNAVGLPGSLVAPRLPMLVRRYQRDSVSTSTVATNVATKTATGQYNAEVTFESTGDEDHYEVLLEVGSDLTHHAFCNLGVVPPGGTAVATYNVATRAWTVVKRNSGDAVVPWSTTRHTVTLRNPEPFVMHYKFTAGEVTHEAGFLPANTERTIQIQAPVIATDAYVLSASPQRMSPDLLASGVSPDTATFDLSAIHTTPADLNDSYDLVTLGGARARAYQGWAIASLVVSVVFVLLILAILISVFYQSMRARSAVADAGVLRAEGT